MVENTQVDVRKLSFERAMEELVSIVTRLEGGKVPLEESVTIYERGESLKRRGEELLRRGEARGARGTPPGPRPGNGVGARPAPKPAAAAGRAAPPPHARGCV